jgi:putative ABC transport system substrate-binding protein
LAAELARLKVDLMVTHGTYPTRAAKKVSTTIPVVFVSSGDAVAVGLVTSLARPGGNMTGSTIFATELQAKRLELLKDLSPRLTQVAVLLKTDNPYNWLTLQAMQNAARSMKVTVHEYSARQPGELDSTVAAMAKRRVGAVVLTEDPMLLSNATEIAALAIKHRLPSAGFNGFAEVGGLMSYGANFLELYRRAASIVDKVLKGAKPGDIPIERPTTFEMVVNLKTAKVLGIKIPNLILVQATKIIE